MDPLEDLSLILWEGHKDDFKKVLNSLIEGGYFGKEAVFGEFIEEGPIKLYEVPNMYIRTAAGSVAGICVYPQNIGKTGALFMIFSHRVGKETWDALGVHYGSGLLEELERIFKRVAEALTDSGELKN